VAGSADGGFDEGEAVSEHDVRQDYDDEPWNRRANPAALVHWPALLMGTFGVIQLVFSIAGCIWLPCALVWNWVDPEFFNNDGPQWQEVLLGTIAFAVCALLNWVIVLGARRLDKFENYRLVVWAIVLSFFSLPFIYCGVMTIPVSVWSFVVILHPDVRARFDAVARGNIKQPTRRI